MGLVLARVVRILLADWSIRLGENRLDTVSQPFGGYAGLVNNTQERFLLENFLFQRTPCQDRNRYIPKELHIFMISKHVWTKK